MGKLIPDYASKNSDLLLYDQAFKVSTNKDTHNEDWFSID